jgi:hypothetical protein
MDSEKRTENQSIIKTGLLALFCGIAIGIFYVWYDWSWGSFLSGILAGVGFALTFFFTAVVLRLPRYGCYVYFHAMLAGAVAGLAWWCVAKTHITVLVPVMIGAIAAPLVMWFETIGYDKKTA